MVQYSELTWNYNKELDMFPKGPQKKKTDTIVVIVDGKSPQTIPTMDTPPEARKPPKCRLFVLLTIILILSLVLMAGYCAWLFFSYEIESVPTVASMEHSDSVLGKSTAASPKLEEYEGDVHISTSLPETEKDNIGVENEDKSDFVFLSSFSSVESEYDSSEPYGNSETSLTSSVSWPEVYDYSDSEPSSSISIADTTWKGDQYLSSGDKGQNRFNRLKFLFDKFRMGHDTTVEDGLSYDVMSSYWFQRPEVANDPSYGSVRSIDSDFIDNWEWVPSSDSEEGSGSDPDDSSMSSDWPIDLFSDVFSDVMSVEGSGEDWYGSSISDVDQDFIPRPVEPPLINRIDQSPPERIEISVCNWPQKLFEKEAHSYGSVKMAQYPDPNYDVTSLSTSNVFITQIRSETENQLTARIFMRDYSASIVAVREMVKTATSTTSKCYFSFLSSDLQQDSFGDDQGRDDEDQFEGSGAPFGGDGLQELTLEIRNPILLGSDLPIFSNPIDKICAHSTKYWATSFHIMQ